MERKHRINEDDPLNDLGEEWKIINCLDWLQDTKGIVEIPDLQVLDSSIEKTCEEPLQTDQILKASFPDK